MEDHTKLVSSLHQAKDQRTLICNSPDIDSLWDFFFETGFVYPEKYQHIYSMQNAIKKNIEKIYIKNPEISRHFIFQDKGVIKGLIALQRVYKLTWMMHHLAARKDAVIAGPKVLSLIGSFIDDSYNDIEQLGLFYMKSSGGLMLKAFDLASESIDETEIVNAYERAGLNRERYLYTLKYKGMPIAIMMVHVTDIGINLSDLINCIHAFIIDAELIDVDIFNSSLSYLVSKHYSGKAVVNLFPSTHSDKLLIQSEKEYTLWIYEMQYSDYYYEHLRKISRLLSIKG